MLSRFKMPFDKIKEAVLTLDPSILTAEAVDNLIQYAPTSEEIEMIGSFEDDRSKLGVTERFFYVMKVLYIASCRPLIFIIMSSNLGCATLTDQTEGVPLQAQVLRINFRNKACMYSLTT